TGSLNFPFASPAVHHADGDTDAFVMRLNESGTAVDFCTYVGGSDYDAANGIDVNVGMGDIFITGLTRSADFPVLNAIQSSYGGGTDAFVTKLSPSGDRILFSTYLGGSGLDVGYGIASNFNAVFVTGTTISPDFPSKNSIQSAAGDQDAFVTKIDLGGSTLLYSTYLGGSGRDGAIGYGWI